MATIDEIMDAMPEEDTATGRDYLVIDPAARSITVPASEKIFGVEGDEEAARKYFICPRYVGDNLDLASMFLTVNWRNAGGDEDGCLVTDVEIDGDYVTFSWLLSDKAVAYKGPLQFSVCADLPNTATKRRPDWNTTTASGEVLEGLDPDRGDVEGETSDVVTQLRAEIAASTAAVEAAGAAQVQNVQAEGSTQVNTVKATGAQTEADALAAIKAQGEATLATIPAEYTDLANQVDKLTRDRAAAIVCQAEGELLQITDAGNDPLQGLRIFGKTEQWKTTGKNLLDVSEENAIYLAGYKNYSVSGGVVTITGLSFFGFKMPVTYGTGYTISLKKRATETTCHFRIYEYSAEPVAIAADDPNYIGNPVNEVCAGKTSVVKNYTPTAEGVAWVLVGFYTTQANVFTEFMAELGAEATAYEPYSGGVAAPCPDWPMELQSVQGPVVRVYGTNLFDASKFNGKTQGGATLTNNGDGSLTVSGSGALTEIFSSLYSDTVLPNLLRPGKLTLVTGTATVPVFHLYAIDGNGQRIFTLNNGQSVDVTQEMIDAMTKVQFVCYAAAGVEITPGTIKPMLYQTGDGTWSAYKEPKALTITTPGSLPGIPVTSGGNYTDAAGQQWIADEVDLARGVYVKRVQSVTFDGTETWTLGDYNGVKYLLFPLSVPGITSGTAGDMCTHAARATWPAVSSLKGDDFFVSPHAFFSTSQGGVNYTSADDWAASLAAQYAAGNPVKILYVRAAPVERALTDAEIQAYLAIHSNKPTTTVLNDAGAHMVLEYAADPKTYIDNKLAALIAANS